MSKDALIDSLCYDLFADEYVPFFLHFFVSLVHYLQTSSDSYMTVSIMLHPKVTTLRECFIWLLRIAITFHFNCKYVLTVVCRCDIFQS